MECEKKFDGIFYSVGSLLSSGRKEKLYDYADVMSTAVESQTVHKNTLIARGKMQKTYMICTS